jgi:hypothetical protein
VSLRLMTVLGITTSTGRLMLAIIGALVGPSVK